MLDFWYSDRCTRQMKLIAVIAACLIITFSSQIFKLSPAFTGISLGIGLLMHVLYSVMLAQAGTGIQKWLHFAQKIPYLLLIILFSCLPRTGSWTEMLMQILQCIGFCAIGLFLVSIYENRAKRFE